MVSIRPPLSRPLPLWAVAGLSLLILFHFTAVVVHVLAASSGPWLVPGLGPSEALGPAFASQIRQVTTDYYLQPLQLASEFHYASNRVDLPHVYFEARLKDDKGDVETLRFPGPKDSAAVRYRYRLLAEGLGGDIPIQMPRGEMIPAKGQENEKVILWYPPEPREKRLTLIEKEPHLVKDLVKDPGMELARPRKWTLLLAQSYARYLCRKHGAVSVELSRHSRNPIMPAMLFLPEDATMPGMFDTLVSQFEEYRCEQ